MFLYIYLTNNFSTDGGEVGNATSPLIIMNDKYGMFKRDVKRKKDLNGLKRAAKKAKVSRKAEEIEVYRKQMEEKRKREELEKRRLEAERKRKEEEKKKRGQYRTFELTAYTAFCDTGCIGITATGLNVKNTVAHKGMRIVAVDSSIIPLNSVVEIVFNNGTKIKAIAADTGGAILGNRIDYLVKTKSRAFEIGRQQVQVKILKEVG